MSETLPSPSFPLAPFFEWIKACEHECYLRMHELDRRCDELRPIAHANFAESDSAQDYEALCVETMDARGEWKEFFSYVHLARGAVCQDHIPAEYPGLRALYTRFISLQDVEQDSGVLRLI